MSFHKTNAVNGVSNGNNSNGHTANGVAAKTEDELYRRIVIVTSIGYVCTMLTVFFVVNDEVPQPYMDEIFHVEQARAYCVGNFSQVSPRVFADDMSTIARPSPLPRSGTRRSRHHRVST